MFNKKFLTLSIIFTVVAIAIVYLFFFSQLPWNLILKDTIVAGGDTGSHNYILYNLKSNFPTLKTWSHDWYGGFPFLYFYPPLLFVFSVILSFFIKLNVAFKIITLLGSFLLPICLFFCLKLLGLKRPIPELGLLAGVAYLFSEAFSIYGGNLPSTLAGEFSYSFSFALFFLFIGLLTKGVAEKKYLLANIIVLSLMVLSHPFSVISAVLYATVLIFLQKNLKYRLWYIFKVFLSAFLLTAFWSIPFLYYHEFTSTMNWYRTIELKDILIQTRVFILLQYGFFLGIFFAIKNKIFPIVNLIVVLLINLALYLSINNSPIYNARFLPFVIVIYLLIGCIGIGTLLQKIFENSNKKYLFAFSIFLIIWGLATINPKFIFGKNTDRIGDTKYIYQWMVWNYSGFESKTPFKKEIVPLMNYLKTLPYGKIMWEYRSEYDKFGTPRFLENLPIWTGKPTFEGLLIESSIFGPFHFINQTETTLTPTSAIAGFEYPNFNFEKGMAHLKMTNANYFIAFTQDIKDLADSHLQHLKDIESFSVYKIQDYEPVQVIKSFDILKKENDWIKKSIDWYKYGELARPTVFYKNRYQLMALKEIDQDQLLKNDVKILKQTNTQLVFETKDLNKLHLIKTTYFPKWKEKSSNQALIVSPAFIGVIPKDNIVEINFKNNFIDNFAYGLSYASLGFLILYIINRKYINIFDITKKIKYNNKK